MLLQMALFHSFYALVIFHSVCVCVCVCVCVHHIFFVHKWMNFMVCELSQQSYLLKNKQF